MQNRNQGDKWLITEMGQIMFQVQRDFVVCGINPKQRAAVHRRMVVVSQATIHRESIRVGQHTEVTCMPLFLTGQLLLRHSTDEEAEVQERMEVTLTPHHSSAHRQLLGDTYCAPGRSLAILFT